MENYLIRALAHNRQARILFVENTGLVRTISRAPHASGLLPITALGTTISVASLLSGTLKDHQRLSLKVTASRPSLRIFADVDAQGNISGYLSDEWQSEEVQDLANLSLADVIGDRGTLQVIKAVSMFQNYTGITDMPYGNIVDDLSYYFNQSEQTPTCFANCLAFNSEGEVIACRGIMAQLLPRASTELIDRIGAILKKWESSGSTQGAVTELPALLFDDVEVMNIEPIQSYCGCSKEMFYPMLFTLGPEELKGAVEQERTVDTVCHRCGEKYSFSPGEIAGLIRHRVS